MRKLRTFEFAISISASLAVYKHKVSVSAGFAFIENKNRIFLAIDMHVRPFYLPHIQQVPCSIQGRDLQLDFNPIIDPLTKLSSFNFH